MNKEFLEEINKNKIPILEEFYSIQGEGANTGKAAYFVRVGGCDLACRWCDSKDSWLPKLDQFVPILEIIERVKQTKADTIVVTGGEPLIYNFDKFCDLAGKAGYKLMLETSGAYALSGVWDWVCLSPKQQKPPKSEFFQFASEVKVVIYNKEDILWAEYCLEKTPQSTYMFLQPEWSKFEDCRGLIVDYAKTNPRWRVSLQTHKFLNIP